MRHLRSTGPAWCWPCLIPSFPLPSLLPAPCLAPCGFGGHSRAAWPGMSLVNPLFDPHLRELSQKGRAPPGQFVCALSSLENWDAQRHWEKLRHSPLVQEELSLQLGSSWCSRELSLGCFHGHFLPLLILITENPRLAWGGRDLKAHLVQPSFMGVSVLQLLELIPIPGGSSLVIRQ